MTSHRPCRVEWRVCQRAARVRPTAQFKAVRRQLYRSQRQPMVHRNPAARSQPAPFLLLAIAAVMGTPQAWSSQSDIDADEEVVFFPTCASYDEVKAQWDVPIHAWVFEPEADSQTRQAALALFRKSLGLAEAQSEHFEERAAAFLVDNERGQTLEINFGQRRFDLGRSGANGHLRAVLSYPMCPERLWEFDPWLGFTPRLKPGDTRRMKGSVQFVRPRGLSVITDIDDTIKVSEVSDKARLLKNTFLEPYEAVAGMAAIFEKLAANEAVFHYVSSSPWQLYEPLEAMLRTTGFPRGSLHLKQFRWKDSSFFDLFAPAGETKLPVVESLIQRFPDRRFVLFGDAGELDPEIYGELARRYPTRILLVCIRLPCPEFDIAARFQHAFRDIPRSRWTVFSDPDELGTVDALAGYLQLPRAAEHEWHGFPRIPPIASADPSTREEREILVPTRLRIRRSENRISVEVDPDSLESIILDVGACMVVGFRREMSVYRDGQPVSSGGYGLGGSWYFGTRNYNTSGLGFPRPGETYEVEVRIQVFETDIPAQHMWRPGSPKYKVLWTRTLRQST